MLLEVWCLLLVLSQPEKKEDPLSESWGEERGIVCLTQLGLRKLLCLHLPILPAPL